MKRRSFLTAAALTTAGFSLPGDATAQAATPTAAPKRDGPRDIPRYPQDAWLDQLPGKHRLFLDATDVAVPAGEGSGAQEHAHRRRLAGKPVKTRRTRGSTCVLWG